MDNNENILKRDAALLELLIRTYGADTIKKEINKTKNIVSDGKRNNDCK